ncbi:hypothetical protein P3T73_04540 [Kiritimatiellota bacterium B12222]|nr:hypothetical protein P3T73_04540 [Kiritimatiellota bacterium B12222]
MRFFQKYLELILTSIGLLICLLLITMIPGVNENKWYIITLVSLVIASIHGLIFFLVRHRERKLRKQVILEATHMLKDRVNNLMFIIINGSNTGDPELEAQAEQSLKEIQSILEALSLESIQSWKDHYGYK